MDIYAIAGQVAAMVAAQVVPPVPGAVKASGRDPREPGKARKEKREDELQKATLEYLARLKKKVSDKLATIPKGGQMPLFDKDFYEDEKYENDMFLILHDAARDGARLSGEIAKIDIDYTLTNKWAAQWARKYVTPFLKDLSDATRANVNAGVEAFVKTPGMTIRDTMNVINLEDETRAMRIAVTEITRAYAEGNLEYGRELAREVPDVRITKTWFTNNDEIVCDLCEELNGKEIDQDKEFSEGVDGPPRHPNCRCWLDVGTRI